MSGDEATNGEAEDGAPFVESVFGDQPEPSDFANRAGKKTSFAPWHHPVKQIVRDEQWVVLCSKLLKEDRAAGSRDVLRYFTLPGADLLDVRVLADALHDDGVRIEYFGFDATGNSDGTEVATPSFSAESALRQSGRVTDDALILPDRLEDIALENSQAANVLRQKAPFDVVNIDACDHLGFLPQGRERSTFDALESLLAHQLTFRKPWLLFVTTRSDPSLLSPHFAKMQSAILDNIQASSEEFVPALADCIGADPATLPADVNSCWASLSPEFLKLYSLGLGKYLLHFFHAQHNLSADVELVSAFAYGVNKPAGDMLSLAFRIRPHKVTVMPATAGAVSVKTVLEAKQGVRMAKKAQKLHNIDEWIKSDDGVRADAVRATAQLLASANFDLTAWRDWLSKLKSRAMEVDLDALGPVAQ